MRKLRRSVDKNIKHIQKKTGNSPDIIYKKMRFDSIHQDIYIIYSDAMVDNKKVNEYVVKSIVDAFKDERIFRGKKIAKTLETILPSSGIKRIEEFDNIFENLFSGNAVILINNVDYAILVETKANLDRGIGEATTEIVVRGPKDAFTENYTTNIGLIRKRIKSPNLWIDQFSVGRETKTKIGIFYMKNIADEKLVEKARKKLMQIDIDGILDSGYIKELMNKDSKTLFPTMHSSERPDTSSMALLNGKIIIMVDNSPFVLIAPTFFMDFLHSSEDYFQKPISASFTRIIRVIAMLISLLLPAYYVSLGTFNHESIPSGLLINMAVQRQGVPLPLVAEVVFLGIVFQILREADIRLPSAIGTSISIVGALVLGEAAVQAGVVSTITVIVVALTAIAALSLPSIEFSNSLRIWRIMFLIFASIFGNVGIMACAIIFILHLSSIKTFGVPYLKPYAPFSLSDMKDNIIRLNMRKQITRPSLINNKNPIRQKVSEDM